MPQSCNLPAVAGQIRKEQPIWLSRPKAPCATSSPKADLLGPVLGMKINMLLKFPQAGFKKEDVADICAKLDALDA